MAGHAPGRPDIDDADLALERGGIEPGHGCAVARQTLERRQRGLRRRPADQRRRNFRRIAAIEPQQESAASAPKPISGSITSQRRLRGAVSVESRSLIGYPMPCGRSAASTPLASSSRRRAFWRAIVDRDPADQEQPPRRRPAVGRRDEGGVGTERHRRFTPVLLAVWPASSASCGHGGARSRCAWPQDAA